MPVVVPCTELTLPFPVFGGLVKAGLEISQPILRLAKLAVNNHTQGKRQDFNESDYAGNAPVALDAGWSVSLAPPFFELTYLAELSFEPSATLPSPGQPVFAYFVCDAFTDGLVWFEFLDPPYVMTAPGHALKIALALRVMDRFAVDPFC